MKPPHPAATSSAPCPCGGAAYATCCGRYHAGIAAPDAAALMRSRYSAYAFGMEPYLLATWHATTRPAQLDLEAAPVPKWIGLAIKSHRVLDADHAEVEFVARYRVGGKAHRLHELSRFVREDGRWYYVDGTFPDDE